MKKQWMTCLLILGLVFNSQAYAEGISAFEGNLLSNSSSDLQAPSLDDMVTVEQVTEEEMDTVPGGWDESVSLEGYAFAEDTVLENSLFHGEDFLTQASDDQSMDAGRGEADSLVEALPVEEAFLSSDEFDFSSDSTVRDTTNSGSCGDNVSWELDSAGVLTISGTGPMRDYSIFKSSPFDENTNIKSVVIEDGITTIGAYMFVACKNLTSVTMPNSVTEIRNSAFEYCSNLRNISLSDHLKSIGNDTFSLCSNLPNLDFPETLTNIGNSAFYACYNMTMVTIPDSVTALNDMVFAVCKNLKSVTIGNGVKRIGKCAFEDCHSLTNLTIGNSVETIEIKAFNECLNLTTVTIPSSVKTINHMAFGYRHFGFNIGKVNGFTIYGNSGSAAQRYAQDNGLNFQKMSDASGGYEEDQFTITKKPTSVETSVNKNKVTVTWKAASNKLLKQIDKIEVQYAFHKSFSSPGTKTVGKKKTKTTLKLDRHKRYYIRVRYVAEDGGTSAWSKVKRIVTE